MKSNNLLFICHSFFLVFVLFQNVFANEEPAMPDINGNWVMLAADGNDTDAIFTITQNGKNLEGMFTDSRDGEVITESPLNGYIDTKGNVIFDIYLGRITVTNRLKLSTDHNTLDGTFSNNMGNQGDVHIRRQ